MRCGILPSIQQEFKNALIRVRRSYKESVGEDYVTGTIHRTNEKYVGRGI